MTLDAPESAERVSAQYYGTPSEARAILLANGLPAFARRPPRLPAKQPLRLPTSWSYRIRPGDTWMQLAADYLGDATQGPFLARMNKKPVVDAAPAGHVIVIPTVIEFTAPRRTRLEKTAALLLDLPERDFRVAALVGWIRDFNGLPAGAPKPAATLRVPLPELRLLGWYVPTSLPPRDPGVRRRVEQALQGAQADLRQGRYVEALDRLSRIADCAGLDSARCAELHLARCTALVALGRSAMAEKAARSALRARPGWVLDPVQVSPKIRAVFERAGKVPREQPQPAARPRSGGRN